MDWQPYTSSMDTTSLKTVSSTACVYISRFAHRSNSIRRSTHTDKQPSSASALSLEQSSPVFIQKMATDMVQALVNGISQVAQGYDASSPTSTRLAILGQASMLMRAVAEPDEMVGIHVANVRSSAALDLPLLKTSRTDDGSNCCQDFDEP